jgi:hypothetical protein
VFISLSNTDLIIPGTYNANPIMEKMGKINKLKAYAAIANCFYIPITLGILH